MSPVRGGGGYNSSFSIAPWKEEGHFASLLRYMQSFFIRKILQEPEILRGN